MNVTPSCSYMIFTECLFCAASVSSRTAHTISPPCPLLVDVFINCSLQNGAGSRSCMPGHCEFNLILSTTLVTGGDTGSQVRAVMVQPLLITVATGSRAQPAAQHSKMLSTTKTCVFSFWWLNSDWSNRTKTLMVNRMWVCTFLAPLMLIIGFTRTTNSAWHLFKITTGEQSETSYKNYCY